LPKAAPETGRAEIPIIAIGSTGAIGGHPSFSVHISSVQARTARRRWEASMKLPRRQFLHLAAGAAALPAVARTARAQAYPTRPVRIIVGFPPGQTGDISARLLGQWLSDRLGQPFVIENRPGASSSIATELVVHAPPDGYTLLWVVTSNYNQRDTQNQSSLQFHPRHRTGCEHHPLYPRRGSEPLGSSQNRPRTYRLRQG